MPSFADAGVAPLATATELLARAHALAGLRIGELAADMARPMPIDAKRAKGFAGDLLERALGATSGSKAQPDFMHLGVELKTMPIDARGLPAESTFVCTAPIARIAHEAWEDSVVYAKLRTVLFVPLEASSVAELAQRRIGRAWLWTPSAEQDAQLRDDWMLLAGIVGRGGVASLTAHAGRALQVRPKAANSRVKTLAFDEDDAPIAHNPRGFYLRPSFTATLVPR